MKTKKVFLGDIECFSPQILESFDLWDTLAEFWVSVLYEAKRMAVLKRWA